MMSNALFFLRTPKFEKLCYQVADQYGLDLDYRDSKTVVFSNSDLQLSLVSKHIMLYLFNQEKQYLLSELDTIFRKGSKL